MNLTDTRAEFQRRRDTAWRLAKPWQALMVLGWVAVAAMFAMYDPREQFRRDRAGRRLCRFCSPR